MVVLNGGTRMAKLKMLEAITAAAFACVLLGVLLIAGCGKKKNTLSQTKSIELQKSQKTSAKSKWNTVKSYRKLIETNETKKSKSKTRNPSVCSSAYEKTDKIGIPSQTKSVVSASSQFNLAIASLKPNSAYEDEDAFAMNKGEIMAETGFGDGATNIASGKTSKRPKRPRERGHGRSMVNEARNRKTVEATTKTGINNMGTNKSMLGLEEMIKRDAEKVRHEDTLAIGTQ